MAAEKIVSPEAPTGEQNPLIAQAWEVLALAASRQGEPDSGIHFQRSVVKPSDVMIDGRNAIKEIVSDTAIIVEPSRHQSSKRRRVVHFTEETLTFPDTNTTYRDYSLRISERNLPINDSAARGTLVLFGGTSSSHGDFYSGPDSQLSATEEVSKFLHTLTEDLTLLLEE